MTLARYEIFVKTVELENMTKAAEAWGYSQTAVSHVVKSLEKEWGFSLFQRGKDGVRLTSEGEQILKPLREVLNWNERLFQTACFLRGLEVGAVRIGSITSVSVHWIPKIIAAFQEKHPHIDFTLMNHDDYREVERWISDGSVDCGFLSLQEPTEFDFFTLYRDKMLAVLHKKHPLAKLRRFPRAQIAFEPFIMPADGANYDLGRIMREAKVTPHVKFCANDDEVTLAMVAQGLGMSVLPRLFVQGHEKEICAMELEPRGYRIISMAVKSLRTAAPATRTFLNFARRWVEHNVSLTLPEGGKNVLVRGEKT